MKKTEHSITVNNKKYTYSIASTEDKGMIYFECKAARIGQRFLAEDIPALLIDLPEMILDEIEHRTEPKTVIRFRVTSEDKRKIMKNAQKNGYKNISSFLRNLALGKL